ncbi:MAG: hypothetical protein ABIS50_01550 [Luteolibacter sp.]|uniref:hypothetical protein n=1 Tax=Luteolibacter sp. TaxID=1962973 RepID=UPI003264E69A
MPFPSVQELPVSGYPEAGSNPPSAHEDLTIAEILETMRVNDEHRPGEQCFLGERDQRRWISDTELLEFVKDHGAEHPSNYLEAHGIDWKENFFNN